MSGPYAGVLLFSHRAKRHFEGWRGGHFKKMSVFIFKKQKALEDECFQGLKMVADYLK
ncbi:hypothetical protein PQ478_11580 [Alkalihalophilus pseudofirmus]|uniref:hypothetical protein n=1 Tax=Alkalihalophilus pseudofirmus TaxID=79885 RepID=UPI00259B3778|nr:hypothetical protein [Alkalihalophilus pseudofirmus]WEG15180.1 hypothetical protein PQ478_11580 [Alkalihalophilus pseudofirmus]